MRYWLVGYDIADMRRLQRVGRFMEDYGQRLQYSVFLCRLEPQEMQRMRRRLRRLLNLKEDRVFLLPLCRECFHRMEQLGRPLSLQIDQDYWIL
ncbi:CRISPR-associated endonuclease Cas2 [Rhodothermus profundi]|uniref:CRISPR-associated endoribonuclease Cas2 n=1 Tax=Rhodothermus profundi TaxID=633813 RepID=A0A1M6SLY2_9BACT|nr:CRISPR-associated endonuclease Cas2 [Rhodothermus profundi]SHK45761.1 CRISPR-associated protein, Cas2 family [Rhodothermus profundi]